MPEQTQLGTVNKMTAWNEVLRPAVCESCDSHYALPAGVIGLICPTCWQKRLAETGASALPSMPQPELHLPFTISAAQIEQQLHQFARGLWFAPGDLKPETLRQRLQRLYLPVWLVDSQVEAQWQADLGYDYEVVSHRDSFDENRGGWHSEQITETRINWKPRLGRLQREYHNIAAPALEEHEALLRRLGDFDLAAAQPYGSPSDSTTLIRLPDRSSAEAWLQATPKIQAAALDECRLAGQAEHIRGFRWRAHYPHQTWSLLLLPVLTTYYLDDDNRAHSLLLHGQTGRLHGAFRASMRRAQRAALIIAIVAGLVFMLSLLAGLLGLLVVPELQVVAGFGLFLALLIGVLGIVPIIGVWQFNRSNRPLEGN